MKCDKKFDLYSDRCMDCGENEKTVKLYELCRSRYLKKFDINDDIKENEND
mgnify:CR=1 FL=1